MSNPNRASLREMLAHLAQRPHRIPNKLMKAFQKDGPRRLWADLINADKNARRSA